ncbi:MAG TPA: hypothetical protein HA282_02110 [Nanoarchaeota archaeon]|nr:MAG: hypothetical protein QT01_C0002G0075 [archaeon GW2011_AR6]HIH18231.1 hypothetical protein [Nanoarchaeota archaeon]HIH34245.1 hypothetical protein [Nanoarchaeota archaeon]HIH50897.1 hypothetical protein [Nanoarchaeota archaeon]HIH65989.1 hypothetical protein [Nanoarchaeota archaeon]
MFNKRGQIVIFIVIMILIIAAILIVLALRFRLVSQVNPPGTKGPQIGLQFEAGIKECIRNDVRASFSGESLGAEVIESEIKLFKQHQDQKYPYLCYTQSSYSACVNQFPFLRETYEKEISANVKAKSKDCIADILAEAGDDGYEVQQVPAVEIVAQIKPDKIDLSYRQEITITKGNDRLSFKKFDVTVPSNLNLFLDIATDTVNSEAKYGNYDQLSPMLLNPRLAIQRLRVDDSTLYTLRRDGENFRFATRSYYLPPGLY